MIKKYDKSKTRMDKKENKVDAVVFEVSWEVVNKVGGINTVLASKAARMKKAVRNYFTVGPYVKRRAAVYFEEEKPSEEFKKVFDKVEKEHGIKCYSGHWLVTGRPKCILLEPSAMAKDVNKIKKELWDDYEVDCLSASDEPIERWIYWGRATGIVLDELIKGVFSKEKCVIHFHEWLCGSALLYNKKNTKKAKIAFTTHATAMGRTLSGAGIPLYEDMNEALKKKKAIEDSVAYEYNVQFKHLIEKRCAQEADAFSTVSEITAKEAQYVLGEKPRHVLPNGLDLDKFPVTEELATLHVKHRNVVRAFVQDFLTPYYSLDINNTLLYFLAGRHEFKNKGIDLFIDALGALNKKISKEKNPKTVVALIWVPAKSKGINPELLKHLSIYSRMEEEIDHEIPEVKARIFAAIGKGLSPDKTELLSEEFLQRVKKMIVQLRSHDMKKPPVCVFDMEGKNEIVRAIEKNKLLNEEKDKVKVIYYPTYLSPADGLIGLDYYSCIMACHLGVFPSYYEPWGYTPLETAALGLSSITSDFAGFGRFIEKRAQKRNKSVIDVVHREGKTYKQAVSELTNLLYNHYSLNKRERVSRKIEAKHLSYLCDWKTMAQNYFDMYNKLLKINIKAKAKKKKSAKKHKKRK